MDLSGTHGKRLNRKYRFYENRERTVYFPRNGRRDEVLRMRILLRLKFQELLVVTEPGVTSVRIELHQLGLRYTAKRRLAALERPEAKDR